MLQRELRTKLVLQKVDVREQVEEGTTREKQYNEEANELYRLHPTKQLSPKIIERHSRAGSRAQVTQSCHQWCT